VSALGELTASLAHELNQPLTAILNNAQVAERLLAAAVPNLEEVLELAADLPTVRGDRVQLQQVVLNLVLNGLDAMHESGAGERTLVIRTARDGGDAVAVSVQDAGTGIDEKNVDQLFQPLFTTKTEGLGMGLAIVRTIIDAHGGRLHVANNMTAGPRSGSPCR
jgi:two-component system sensor kinase FixL